MKREVISCDRCKCVITSTYVEIKMMEKKQYYEDEPMGTEDLCKDCFKKIEDIINQEP